MQTASLAVVSVWREQLRVKHTHTPAAWSEQMKSQGGRTHGRQLVKQRTPQELRLLIYFSRAVSRGERRGGRRGRARRLVVRGMWNLTTT